MDHRLMLCIRHYHQTLTHLKPRVNSSMLSSRTFIVLHFRFRSMIRFELFLGRVWSLCLGSFVLCLDVQLPQHYFLKGFSLLHCIDHASLPKMTWLYLCESLFGLYFGFLIYLPILWPIPLCLGVLLWLWKWAMPVFQICPSLSILC